MASWVYARRQTRHGRATGIIGVGGLIRCLQDEAKMVHLGVGGQYIVEGGSAYGSSNPDDVIIETKKIVSCISKIQ